jgi:probable HAF family extracellular repeat protein
MDMYIGRLSALIPLIACAVSAYGQDCRIIQNLEIDGKDYSTANLISADGKYVIGEKHIGLGKYGARWSQERGLELVTPLYDDFTEIHAISDDGMVLVGSSEFPGGSRAIRWTAEGGTENLGLLEGATYSRGIHASSDGSVIIGRCNFAGTADVAYRWTREDGMQPLPDLGGSRMYATRITPDGRVITGYGRNASNAYRAFIWTEEDGLQDLGALDATPPTPTAISDDGSTIIGTWGSSGTKGFRWTVQHGMQDLAQVVGAQNIAVGYALSADGSVIVGRHHAGVTWRAFRWSLADGLQALHTQDSYAFDVSANGSVVVGMTSGTGFRWSANRGYEELPRTWPGFMHQSVATTITPDGKTIAGRMVNPAKTYTMCVWHDTTADFDGSGFVDTDDFTAYVQAFEAGADNADFDRSGFVDTDDFSAFVTAFEAGC